MSLCEEEALQTEITVNERKVAKGEAEAVRDGLFYGLMDHVLKVVHVAVLSYGERLEERGKDIKSTWDTTRRHAMQSVLQLPEYYVLVTSVGGGSRFQGSRFSPAHKLQPDGCGLWGLALDRSLPCRQRLTVGIRWCLANG